MVKNLVFGDFLIIMMFSWVMSQAIISFDLIWFFVALWIFDMYAVRRRSWTRV